MGELTEKKSIFRKYFGNKAFYKMVLAIALPIMIQNGITNFVNLLDNIMVGQIGTEQMSGVAIVNQLFFIFNLSLFGLCSGIGIFTAQYHGAGNDEGVRQTFRAKLIMSLIVTVVFGLIFYFASDGLIGIFLNDGSQEGDLAATLSYAKEYLFILLIGFVPFAVTMAYSSTLRELESSLLPMIAGFIAVIFNCIGNYILIFGKLGCPVLGVKGAAISTAVSRYIELLIIVIATHVQKNKFVFAKGIYLHLFSIGKDLFKNICRKGLPLFFNELLWACAMSALAQAYSVRGLAVVAAYSISSTVFNLFSIVYISLGNSIGIITGKYLGYGDFDTAIDYDRKLIVFSIIMGTLFGGIMCALSPVFPKIYNTTDEVKEIAMFLIIVAGCTMPIESFNNASYFTLRSGGKTGITFVYDSIFVSCFNVPLAMILVHCTSLGIVYVYMIVYISDFLKSVIGFTLIKKKVWLNKLV